MKVSYANYTKDMIDVEPSKANPHLISITLRKSNVSFTLPRKIFNEEFLDTIDELIEEPENEFSEGLETDQAEDIA